MPEQQLEALNAAVRILDQARDDVAGRYASTLPYAKLSSAYRYVRKQADELLAPIFTEEN